jgi:hypothetical protein
MGWRRWHGIAAVLGGALFSSGKARAAVEYPGLKIVWVAPESCPSELQVVARTERLVGRSLGRAGANRLDLGVEVTQALGEFTARLTVINDGQARTRTLRQGDCTELAEATALVMALTIDPDATLESDKGIARPAGSTATEPAAASLSAPPPAGDGSVPEFFAKPPPPRPPPRPVKHRPRVKPVASLHGWALGGELVMDEGVLSETGYGLGAAVTRRLGEGVALQVLGRWWPSQAMYTAGTQTSGLALSLWTVGPLLCLTPDRGTGLFACGGAELGQLQAERARDLTLRRDASFWFAADLQVGAKMRLTEWLGARFAVEGTVPALLDTYEASSTLGRTVTWQASDAGIRVMLGLDLLRR